MVLIARWLDDRAGRNPAGTRGRFLAGNAEMLEHAYEQLARGESWETIGAGEF